MSIPGRVSLYPKFRSVLAAAVLLSTTACSNHAFVNGLFPGPLFARNFPPPGPANYQGGMKDGCQTAISAMSLGTPYGAIGGNGFVFDANLGLTDTVYYKAWKDGYNYCKGEHAYYQS